MEDAITKAKGLLGTEQNKRHGEYPKTRDFLEKMTEELEWVTLSIDELEALIRDVQDVTGIIEGQFFIK